MKTCTVDGCDRPLHAIDRCRRHYEQHRRKHPSSARPARTCSIEGCDRKHKALGLCDLHWRRSRDGIPLDASPRRQSELTVEALIEDVTELIEWREHPDRIVARVGSPSHQALIRRLHRAKRHDLASYIQGGDLWALSPTG